MNFFNLKLTSILGSGHVAMYAAGRQLYVDVASNVRYRICDQYLGLYWSQKFSVYLALILTVKIAPLAELLRSGLGAY